MKLPQGLRSQLREYEKAGFHVVDCQPASGSHFKMRFAEFSEPQVVSRNLTDKRALKNNIARFRRLARGV